MDKLDYIEYDFKQMLETGRYHVTPGDIHWLIEQVKSLREALKEIKRDCEVKDVYFKVLEDN